jgi:hypothetical protein
MIIRAVSFGAMDGDELVIKTRSRSIRLRKSEKDSDETASKIEDRVRSRMIAEERDQFHVHKNRDGSFTYALGEEPTVWPEDD